MATVSLYLDTRRANKDGNFPVKLRVTHNRLSKYFKTSVYIDQKSFDRVIAGNYLSEELKKIRNDLFRLSKKVDEIIKDLDFFSFTAVEERLTGKGVSNDFLKRLQERISENKVNGKIGTANIDSDVIASIKLFLKETKSKLDGFNLPLNEITPEWLKKYQDWNQARGISDTTIHIHNIRIKAVINQAIQKQVFDQKKYPYGKGRYMPPKPANNKRALNEDQLVKFLEYKPKDQGELFAKDFFIFSLLSSGMNLGDVFSLKWSNFHGKESFTFRRRKTRSKTPIEITIQCRPDHLDIIERQGSRKVGINEYVFGVVVSGLDPAREHQLIKMAINKVNVYLKKISESLELGFNVTSYHARHTYATRLMGTAPIGYISQQLGHSNISTTQHYLGQFSSKESQKFEENLLPKFG